MNRSHLVFICLFWAFIVKFQLFILFGNILFLSTVTFWHLRTHPIEPALDCDVWNGVDFPPYFSPSVMGFYFYFLSWSYQREHKLTDRKGSWEKEPFASLKCSDWCTLKGFGCIQGTQATNFSEVVFCLCKCCALGSSKQHLAWNVISSSPECHLP